MKLPALTPALLALQTPAVRAQLAALGKPKRKRAAALTVTAATVTRTDERVTVLLDGMLLKSLSNSYNWWQAKEIKKAQSAVLCPVLATIPRPALPLDVTITRVGWQRVDPKNLDCAAKRVIDDCARWLDVDDARDDLVRYVVTQEKGPPAVRVVVERRTGT